MNDSDLLEQTSTAGAGEADIAGTAGTTRTEAAATGGADGHSEAPSATGADARPSRRRASRPVGGTPNGSAPNGGAASGSANAGLAGKLLPELQQIASGLGLSGIARLRKGQLIVAIQQASVERTSAAGPTGSTARGTTDTPATAATATKPAPTTESTTRAATPEPSAQQPPANASAAASESAQHAAGAGSVNGRERQPRDRPERPQGDRPQGDRQPYRDQRPQQQTQQQNGQPGQSQPRDDDSDAEGRRGRRGRYRDRRRNRDRPVGQGAPGGEVDTTIREDDVLLPVAGILDINDNYAFLRTSGYLAGPSDVYVSMNHVRRYGLRRGDALTGAVKANASESEQQGNRKEKYNPLVRLDTINGVTPEEAKQRPDFGKLVPLYPQERLRLETESNSITTRVIDLIMPIGKGQRALIVSPPKAGKTMVLQAIANAITTNNPECHLMVVLVDERPEEVTDMQRSVKGEVIASTFDRPAQDHTIVAELAIERAKRLVELGHDVVVLLDSITRLGRAYNLAAPASGRIMSGGVDSTALYPPKRFLGAARNVEHGGSLTILATALVETGSQADTVIYEEFKGTGNAELKLDRKIADKRVFPAVDIDPSGTRKEDLLMSPEEMAIVIKLRRVLHALESQQAMELLIDKLKHTRTNIEFLMQIAKTASGE